MSSIIGTNLLKLSPLAVIILIAFIANAGLAIIDDKDGPIQLVRPDDDHKGLQVVESSIQMLRSLEGPVAVVAVVGKFHSGKSFLMNQLMGKSNGFGIGPSVQPKTMGIWMWGKPLEFHSHLIAKKIQLIFLDTEGFAANNVTENYDAKVFAVSTLLSSYLLYNSVKIIDQSDIDYLELLARRTQLFALRSQMSKNKWTSDLNHDLLTFPPLTWVVQDFVQEQYELESPTQWLHRLMLGHSRESDNYTISLLDIFERVDCHTLFIPAFSKDLLTDLSRATDADLHRDYRKERDQLIKKIRASVVPKERNDRFLTGADMAQLLHVLVKAANDGSLADVPSRWDAFVERLQSTAADDCKKFYESELDIYILDANKNEPVSLRAFDLYHEQIKSKAHHLLEQLLHGLEDALTTAKRDLLASIQKVYMTKRDLNDKKIRLKCSQTKNAIELETEGNLKKLSLPLRSNMLQKEAEIIKLRAAGRMQEILQDLLDSESMLEHGNALKKSIDTLIAATVGENRRQIEAYLASITDNLVQNFVQTVKPDNKKTPRKPSVLKSLISQVHQNSVEDFKVKAVDFRDETMFASSLALLSQTLQQKAEASMKENDRIAEEYIKSGLDKLVNKYRERTGAKYFTLPIDEEHLEQRLNLEANKVYEEFDSAYGDYNNCCEYSTIRKQLTCALDNIKAAKQKENIQSYREIVDDVLIRAKDIIKMSQDKYTSVFSFKRFVSRVCSNLLQDGKSSAWSVALKDKVIDDFMADDSEIKVMIGSKVGMISTIIGFFEWLYSWFFFK